jgi:hypothetical protein
VAHRVAHIPEPARGEGGTREVPLPGSGLAASVQKQREQAFGAVANRDAGFKTRALLGWQV